MKLATYRADDTESEIGVVIDNDTRVFALAKAAARAGDDPTPFASMRALMEAGPASLDAARRLVEKLGDDGGLDQPLENVTLLSPVPVPAQIRDFLCFPTHVRQAPLGMRKLTARLEGEDVALARYGPELNEPGPTPEIHKSRPIYYKANRFSVVGTDHDVRWPKYSEIMDFELEFGFFLGTGGVDIPRDTARAHIFGYAIFNDFSARDMQMREMLGRLGPSKGKDFDTGNAIGPWIVTADEIDDPYSLKMEARINGEVWASGDSSGMLHSFEDMISFVSQDETLMTGEFFGSGTMGNGCGLEMDRYLKDGDIVELEVEGIGVLRNTVHAHG
jgi:2-keto-4-pentenoate hydratase/2-oxohepta-3-ene-1,7-dioic acid hydratase in catechol pathway